jgi:replicative DNA helicase
MKINNSELNKIEEKLITYAGEDKMISSLEFAEIISKEPEPQIVMSGLPTLDKVLNGFEQGELIVVSGPTNHGKTTLLLTILSNMVEAGVKSSFFTMENSPRSFIKKFKGGNIPLFYLPMKNTENHIDWLLEKIIEGCVKYNTRVVFIDHLHQIFSIERMKGNLSLEIGDIVAKLKQIAVEYGLVVFLVAHCTDNKLAMSYEPTMRDIRDSGMISRLADSVLGVWRIEKQNNVNDLYKEKVAEQDDTNADNHYNKIRIWKSRREGQWGTFFCYHENHKFMELDISKMEGSLSEFEDKKVARKKSDITLGF